MEAIKGFILIYGDNVDTDQIYPGRFLELTFPQEIAKHAMEGVDPAFHKRLKLPGIIVGGKNFGCGSSREHAVITLKTAGVRAIVAESFGRIFYRNAINLGLPTIICPGIASQVEDGLEMKIDLSAGLIQLIEKSLVIAAPKMPAYVTNILEQGGLIASLRAQRG